MNKIKVGSIVRISTERCKNFNVSEDEANELGRVVAITQPKNDWGEVVPARARVHWETGPKGGVPVSYLEVYLGTPSLAARREWGMEE